MKLVRGTGVALVLMAVAACSASTTGGDSRPAGSAPATTSAPSWSGTDLLWDAIGGPAGFTAVGK